MRRLLRRLVLAFLFLTGVGGVSSTAQPSSRPTVYNEDAKTIGIFPRPTQADVDLIRSIAAQGAPQQVSFPEKANVVDFVAQNCGQPSSTVRIHPVYEEILLSRNPPLNRTDLQSLPTARSLEIPACGVFAETTALPAPYGVEALTTSLSVPFNTVIFQKVVGDSQLRTKVQQEFTKTSASDSGSDANSFQSLVERICATSDRSEPGLNKYRQCVSTVQIVGANPKIKNADRIKDDVLIPALAKPGGLDEKVARVPLKSGDATSGAAIPPSGKESALQFVNDVSAAENDNCVPPTEAWPVSLTEFMRVLSLTSLGKSETVGRILVVDTGFDFGDGEAARLPPIRRAFPDKYLHRFETSVDPDPARDGNLDGIRGNGGWAGVNLTGPKGGLSAQTSINYDRRSHGLSVATLALGGREFEQLRRIARLPLKIGFASLVPLDAATIVLDSGHVVRAINYAAPLTNDFNIINLSLSSTEEIHGLLSTVQQKGARRTIVVAAGNHGSDLGKQDDREWPAAYGGEATSDDDMAGAFITVGAHDEKYQRARFSNYGLKVDVLAPGCAIPTYELQVDDNANATGIAPQSVSGTSFAAPLVSFTAAILASSPQFSGRPGLIKARIAVSSDYAFALRYQAFSSGTLNIPKAIAFEHDVLVVSAGTKRKMLLGKILNKAELASTEIECGGEKVLFSSVRKIGRSSSTDQVLLFVQPDDSKPSIIKRRLCEPSAVNAIEFKFNDAETDEASTVKAADIWDYVPSL